MSDQNQQGQFDRELEARMAKRREEFAVKQQRLSERPSAFKTGMKVIGDTLGQIFGIAFVGALGFGVLGAFLGPGSCSSGGYSGEYRAP
jgi:hypothetical protein